ncbi:hypothetical protein ACF0H5_006290 [Mactra antiquata]
MTCFSRRGVFSRLGYMICLIGVLYLISKKRLSTDNYLTNILCNQNKYIGYGKNQIPNSTWSMYESRSTTAWTVLLTVNTGFFDFFSNWFFYYSKLKLDLPIVIIAEDDKVYKKLKTLCSYCQVSRSKLNISEATNFSTIIYKKFVSQRPSYILRLLHEGKNVLYADVDSVWLHNPLPYFNASVDFTYQLDLPQTVCTGFLAIKNNSKTIKMVDEWHKIMTLQSETTYDQTGLNQVFKKYSNSIRNQALNTLFFPNGLQYFKEFNMLQRSSVVVVHNNYIIGHDNKKKRFQKFGLWAV